MTTTTPQPRRTDARRIKLGDLLYVAGRTHRVTKLVRLWHPTLGQYRMAYCEEGWQIALYPGDRIETWSTDR